MAKEEKIMMTMMMAIMMMAVMGAVLPTAQAATFCCPLESGVCFTTYDLLYEHFTSAHPADPIEIIWE